MLASAGQMRAIRRDCDDESDERLDPGQPTTKGNEFMDRTKLSRLALSVLEGGPLTITRAIRLAEQLLSAFLGDRRAGGAQ